MVNPYQRIWSFGKARSGDPKQVQVARLSEAINRAWGIAITVLGGLGNRHLTSKQNKGVYTLDKQSKFVKSVGLTLVFTPLRRWILC